MRCLISLLLVSIAACAGCRDRHGPPASQDPVTGVDVRALEAHCSPIALTESGAR